MNDKEKCRKTFSGIRKNIEDKRAKSFSATEYFVKSDLYKNAKSIMLYYPLKNEFNTLFLFERLLSDKKTALFPKTDVHKNEILPVLYTKKGFIKGAYGIYEPIGEIYSNTIDLIVVPALAIDGEKFRLGYGGGYYDRFLENYRGKTVSLIFSELLCGGLPHDTFDIKVETVFTQNGELKI